MEEAQNLLGGLLAGMVASVALVASPANAQDRLEISAFFGQTFSEGVP